jgi:phospholipid-binding lipoprotein MlaA
MSRAGLTRRLQLTVSIAAFSLMAAACSTAPVVHNPPPNEARFEYDRVVAHDLDLEVEDVYDPWEGFNRRMYRFNATADRWVLMPMVRGYRFVFPPPVRQGVSNVFDTIFAIRTFANQILQGRPVRAAQTVGRVGVNLTLGVVGLFDVASRFGMPYHVEDFGQTLGVWGLGPGPYLVLPIAGPSSLRDGGGQLVDSAITSFAFTRPVGIDGNLAVQAAYYPLMVVDTRGRIAFQYYETGSPFEYEFVRMMIDAKRKLEIEK